MLAFLIKACASALRKFPEFNASLEGESLVYKRYFHIGFAPLQDAQRPREVGGA